MLFLTIPQVFLKIYLCSVSLMISLLLTVSVSLGSVPSHRHGQCFFMKSFINFNITCELDVQPINTGRDSHICEYGNMMDKQTSVTEHDRDQDCSFHYHSSEVCVRRSVLRHHRQHSYRSITHI